MWGAPRDFTDRIPCTRMNFHLRASYGCSCCTTQLWEVQTGHISRALDPERRVCQVGCLISEKWLESSRVFFFKGILLKVLRPKVYVLNCRIFHVFDQFLMIGAKTISPKGKIPVISPLHFGIPTKIEVRESINESSTKAAKISLSSKMMGSSIWG